MINNLNLPDGPYVDDSGCHWDSVSDYIAMDLCDSCGCGDPKSIALYVRDMLKKHVMDHRLDNSDVWHQNSYDDLPMMFFLSWSDKKGYIEHGSTIRCSWLTDEGQSLVDAIDWYIGND